MQKVSNFSHETAGLLAFITTPKNKQKNQRFVLIAEATKTATAVLVAGKFETLGSNFSHEIRFCEAAGVRCYSK